LRLGDASQSDQQFFGLVGALENFSQVLGGQISVGRQRPARPLVIRSCSRAARTAIHWLSRFLAWSSHFLALPMSDT
jgi:hypothetical protein